MTWVRVSVVATIPAYHQRSLAELLSGGVVGLGIAEATAAIALLRDDRPGALARLEPTAAGGAVRVTRAGPGDELAAGRDRGRGGRRGGRGSHGRRRGGGRGRSGRGGGRRSSSGGRRRSLAAELARGVVIRLRVPEATAAVALLGNDGPGALPGLEPTAPRGTVGVARARASDELTSRGDRGRGGGGRGGRGGRDGCGGRCGGVLTAELAGGVVVGLGVTEAAAAVALLGDDCSGALAGLKAAAARGTIDIPRAGAGDELRARRRTGDVRRSSD